MKSEEFNASLSSSHCRGKVLIKDDGENGCGKGRVGKIIHRPAKDLSFLNRHIDLGDGVTRGNGEGVNFSPCRRVPHSPYRIFDVRWYGFPAA